MIDPSYGNHMAIDAFFNAPDLPADQIGGWLVRGHDAKDIYQEFVVPGKWTGDAIPADWIDWVRVPIPKGIDFMHFGGS